MTELFCAAHQSWTDDGIKPIEWLTSDGLKAFDCKIDSGEPVTYVQYDQTFLTQLRSEPQWQWDVALNQYFLQDDRIFDFWHKNKIRNHSLRHVQHVLHFCAIMNSIEQLDEKDALILLLTACFHDIGRVNADVAPDHGAQSVARLYDHYHLSEAVPIETFTEAFTLQSMVLLNSQSNYPMPELRANDVRVMLDLMRYHSLEDTQAETDFKERYNDRAAQRRLRLLHLFKDCDALDRLRFKGNLDVHYLRTTAARRMLRISAGFNGLI
ncbi:hypothetical protein ACFQ5M_09875 [Agrilactobacillus yilanensis]|uniref:HD domain-containing protein n=1 Tax=Agrilactobacillus yilanensis TaxID=2485997 RepID=A0ABW4J7R9_9LACO|nr:hypothetical protein [Agrilactobacillus yilanensis]